MGDKVTRGEQLTIREYRNATHRGLYLIKHDRSTQPLNITSAGDAVILIGALIRAFGIKVKIDFLKPGFTIPKQPAQVDKAKFD
jgi:hypothetical protein